MENIIRDVLEHKEWIFSGIGVFFISLLFAKKEVRYVISNKVKNIFGIRLEAKEKINNKKTSVKEPSANKPEGGSVIIPPRPSKPHSRPPLDLQSIRLYSTGSRGKVFTDHFYRAMNHNFGVEIKIKNNTNRVQDVKIAGYVYDSVGNTVVGWKTIFKKIQPNSLLSHDSYVNEHDFSCMKDGEYKVQFWVNDVKIKKFFKMTYK